ncbi:RNA exonuclease 1 homolog [Haemaphysalis longicornis]
MTHPHNGKGVVSLEMSQDDAPAARTSFNIDENCYRKPAEDLTASRFYELLEAYRMSPEQLVENNYPSLHPTMPGRALFGGTDPKHQYSKPHEPVALRCSRCQATFSLTVEGQYTRKDDCCHHRGSLYLTVTAGDEEFRYSCCQGDSQSNGCCVVEGHVHEGPEPKELTGFVSTLGKSPAPVRGCPGVYAVDCEMCYTSQGKELTRVTVVGWDLRPVYEALVKPQGRILDYNTRFSGLTEKDLEGVQTTLGEVQAKLLSLFSSTTLLLGHSLNVDLRALRLVHTYVVDTAVVFPHRRGLPFKRALRTLAAKFLKKIIQNGVDGHDSQEDAATCMELMLWRVSEDLKKDVR